MIVRDNSDHLPSLTARTFFGSKLKINSLIMLCFALHTETIGSIFGNPGMRPEHGLQAPWTPTMTVHQSSKLLK